MKKLKKALGRRLLTLALDLLEVPDGTRYNIELVIATKTGFSQVENGGYSTATGNQYKGGVHQWWKQGQA